MQHDSIYCALSRIYALVDEKNSLNLNGKR